MRTAIVIPARFQSSRFPGKPLANIKGKTLLERTWRIACEVPKVNWVTIATDDDRIAEYAKSFGAIAQMTDLHWSNGSERILQALERQNIAPDIVINLQGDAVLTPPFVISALLKAFEEDTGKDFSVATPCVQLNKQQYLEMSAHKKQGVSTGTLVTFDKKYRALYFSRSVIPLLRNDHSAEQDLVPVYRHIGLYGYRLEALKDYVNLAPTPLERAEGLEQLRLLENGLSIKVVPVDYRGRTHWSVDEPADVAIVEDIIEKEGELVKPTA